LSLCYGWFIDGSGYLKIEIKYDGFCGDCWENQGTKLTYGPELVEKGGVFVYWWGW
jgi:hypothetical protein